LDGEQLCDPATLQQPDFRSAHSATTRLVRGVSASLPKADIHWRFWSGPPRKYLKNVNYTTQ
jgi:hypothetical protein